jgi:hypothetical protein
MALSVCIGTACAGSAVVTNGRFTNVYVFPGPDTETWEQHMARLRPADSADFSREAIDRFTGTLMNPIWPSYFDALMQYNGIHPPRFFGSSVASKACVDAAMHDLHNGVMQWDTIRSLANCHPAGMDPSPQVNLIFSPDIRIASIAAVGTGSELCTNTNSDNAWHAWGLNTPNFVALPTSIACMPKFTTFTQAMSHEVVETISDPAGMGIGDPPSYIHELGDNCEKQNPPEVTTVGGYPPGSLERYWSNFDGNCQPRLDPPPGATAETWVLGQGSPLERLTGSVHTLDLSVPPARVTTDAPATQVQVVIQTGSDDLRGGGAPGENANVTLNFAGGSTTTVSVNGGRNWGNGETHAALLTLPTPAPRVSDITGVTISTQFGGGPSGDNWNIDKVALVVSFPTASTTQGPVPVIVHEWLDASGGPLVRFTGNLHDFFQAVPPQDVGVAISALNLVISTGNDDLRGGSHPGDNCDVTVVLASGPPITLTNVNGGHNWVNWTDNTVAIPLPSSGLKGGDVKSVQLHTGFGGGIGGDNWNVNRIQLKATLASSVPAPPPSIGPPNVAPTGCAIAAGCGCLLDVSCAVGGGYPVVLESLDPLGAWQRGSIQTPNASDGLGPAFLVGEGGCSTDQNTTPAPIVSYRVCNFTGPTERDEKCSPILSQQLNTAACEDPWYHRCRVLRLSNCPPIPR